MADQYIQNLVRLADGDENFYDDVVKTWIRKSRRYGCFDEYVSIINHSTESLEVVTERVEELIKTRRKKFLEDRKIRRKRLVSDKNEFLELVNSPNSSE